MRPLCLRLCLCVLFGKDLVASAEHVTGPLNGKVRLPCTYSAATTTMCWGRGECPSSKCSREIIWTDGHNVTWRKSDRYHHKHHNTHQLLQNIIIHTSATVEHHNTHLRCCRTSQYTPPLLQNITIHTSAAVEPATESHNIHLRLLEVPLTSMNAPSLWLPVITQSHNSLLQYTMGEGCYPMCIILKIKAPQLVFFSIFRQTL
ncbi:Hepatitis A virus cellular receptor 1 homolog [Pristimantis euphronides]